MYSGDAHTLWLNSCALERLGITEDSESPAGGSYDKDADGHLTGIVREAAAMELMPRIVAEFSREELLCAYRSFERYLNEHGITGVCDVSLMAMPGLDFVRDDLFGALEEAGELTVRVSMFPTLLEDRSRLADLQAAHTGPLLSARGFKQFFDGVSSQHTAWVHDPYTNARFEGDCGRPTVGAEVMEALVAPAADEGSPRCASTPSAMRPSTAASTSSKRTPSPPPPITPSSIWRTSNPTTSRDLRGQTSSPACSPATSPWIPVARSAIWGPSASLICGPSARFWIPAPPWPSAPTPPLPISIPSTLSTPPSPAAMPIPTSRLGAGCRGAHHSGRGPARLHRRQRRRRPARGRARAAGPGHVRRYRRAGPEPLRAGPRGHPASKGASHLRRRQEGVRAIEGVLSESSHPSENKPCSCAVFDFCAAHISHKAPFRLKYAQSVF